MLPYVDPDEAVVQTFDGYVPNPFRPCQLWARHTLELGHHGYVGEFIKNQEYGADTEVKCDGDAALLHSVVIAAHSNYFRRRLLEEEPPITIDLSNAEINRQGFRKTTEFMYSGQVTVNAESLFQTLRAAITLEVSELQLLLESYLRQIAAHPGCFVMTLNTAFQLPVSYHTRTHVLRLVTRRFDTFYTLSDFSLISLEPLCAVLNRLERRNGNRMESFRAVVKWIVDAPNERMRHSDRLMGLIPFEGITNQQVLECLFMLKQCPEGIVGAVLPRLKEADWHRTCMEAGEHWMEHSNLRDTATVSTHFSQGIRRIAMKKEEEHEGEIQKIQLEGLDVDSKQEKSRKEQFTDRGITFDLDSRNRLVLRSTSEVGSSDKDPQWRIYYKPSFSELQLIPDFSEDDSSMFIRASADLEKLHGFGVEFDGRGTELKLTGEPEQRSQCKNLGNLRITTEAGFSADDDKDFMQDQEVGTTKFIPRWHEANPTALLTAGG